MCHLSDLKHPEGWDEINLVQNEGAGKNQGCPPWPVTFQAETNPQKRSGALGGLLSNIGNPKNGRRVRLRYTMINTMINISPVLFEVASTVSKTNYISEICNKKCDFFKSIFCTISCQHQVGVQIFLR